MKLAITALLTLLISFAAVAAEPKIHCRGISHSLYEVIIQKGKKLTSPEHRALPESLKRKIAGAEQIHKYEMIIFRGEAVPQVLSAIGAQADVLLQVFSLTGTERLRVFLDEIGTQDISSLLNVDRLKVEMSCREI